MTGEPPTANDSAKRVTGDPGIGFGELLGKRRGITGQIIALLESEPMSDRKIADKLGRSVWRTQALLNTLHQRGRIRKITPRYQKPAVYRLPNDGAKP